MNTIINQKNRELALAFLAQIEEKREALENEKGVKLKLHDTEEYLTIPREIFALMVDAVATAAKGKKVEELIGLKEAAEILLLQEDTVMKLVDKGALSRENEEGSPLFLLSAVKKYKMKRRKERLEFLARMVKEDQEMGLYE